MDLQGSAYSMWADTSRQLAPATSGLRLVEFDVGGFFAPAITREINADLSGLSIVV